MNRIGRAIGVSIFLIALAWGSFYMSLAAHAQPEWTQSVRAMYPPMNAEVIYAGTDLGIWKRTVPAPATGALYLPAIQR